MTIERGDTLGPVLPDPDPEPELPKMSVIEKLAHDIDGEVPVPFDLGIAATVSGRNLRALEATTSFQRRPSRYT